MPLKKYPYEIPKEKGMIAKFHVSALYRYFSKHLLPQNILVK